jgi:hypothetical protein
MGLLGDSRLQLTLVNIRPLEPVPGVTIIRGDARDMQGFQNGDFDVVFSNSVIEHLGSLGDMRRMAAEIQRIGKRWFVQTPNRYFPIEPHFLVPLFQFMPVNLRVWLAQRFRLGWYDKIEDREEAEREVASIRLLSRKELQGLFPSGKIWEEPCFGLTKSFVIFQS